MNQTKEVLPETNDVQDVIVLNNSDLVEEVQIDKIDIPEKEEDIKQVDNNAVGLMNVLKANTVFKDVADSEKESTQFKNRS